MARMSRAVATPIPPNPNSQHAVRCKLIEGPGSQLTVLKEEPLRGRQGQGERMLRHRFGGCTTVGSNRQSGRQGLERNKIHPRRVELQQPHLMDECEFVGSQFLGRILRQDDRSPPEHLGPRRGCHVWQVQNIGRRADHFTDYLPSDTLHVE
jgi:hypothetical protein